MIEASEPIDMDSVEGRKYILESSYISLIWNSLKGNSDLKTKIWQWDPQTIVNNGVYLKISRSISLARFLGYSLYLMTSPTPN